ncbi:hypothetical protein [Alsobacter sp. R-9]
MPGDTPWGNALLDRFNLLRTPDHDEACAILDRITGSRRRILEAGDPGIPHEAGALRLAGVNLLASRMPACTVRAQDNATGLLFLVLRGGIEASSGRRQLAAGPGSIACMMPVGDRTTTFAPDTRALVLGFPPDLLSEALEDHGGGGLHAWSDAFAEIPASLPSARRLLRLALDVAELYDVDPMPHRRTDGMFGQSLLAASATLLTDMFRAPAAVMSSSYAIACRAETLVVSRHGQALTLSGVAGELGIAPARLNRALRLHRRVTFEELVDYVRLVAAEVIGGGDEASGWQAAGFPSILALQRATARRAAVAQRLGDARRLGRD